jgi:hypothetical protein
VAGNAFIGAGQVNGGNGEVVFQYLDQVSVGAPNYSDTAGQTLTEPSGDGLLSTATDLGGSPLTATGGGTTAQGGSAVVNADGSFTYTPPSATFNGTDTFSFTASDGSNYSTGTATVQVTGVPPAFTADAPPLAAGTGTPYSYQFAASGVPAAAFSLGGGAPSWLAIDPSTGIVTGTPPAKATSFSYNVTAANSIGSVTTPTFTVAVSNKADIKAALSCPASLAPYKAGACTLTVTNLGPALATRVTAGATVPGNLKIAGCSGGCKRTGAVLAWSLGSLPAGQSDTLTISVTAAGGGVAVVTATSGTASPDPNLLNNLAAATVKVT